MVSTTAALPATSDPQLQALLGNLNPTILNHQIAADNQNLKNLAVDAEHRQVNLKKRKKKVPVSTYHHFLRNSIENTSKTLKKTSCEHRKITKNYEILTSIPGIHTNFSHVVSGYFPVESGNFPVESGLLISPGSKH